MPNNATRTYRKAAAELLEHHGVVTYKRPRRCAGCGRMMFKVNPEGGCLACAVQHIAVTTPPTLIKRRAVVQVYQPEIFTFGVSQGRVA